MLSHPTSQAQGLNTYGVPPQYMPPVKPKSRIQRAPFRQFLLFWYCADVITSLVNWFKWVRYAYIMLSDTFRTLYVVFAITGGVGYLLAMALIFWSHRPGAQRERNDPQAKKRARTKTLLAMVILYFVTDFPVFVMEFYAVYNFGYHHLAQAVSFSITLISWIIGTFVVWTTYMWKAAIYLQTRRQAQFTTNLPPVLPPPAAGGATGGPPSGGVHHNLASPVPTTVATSPGGLDGGSIAGR